MDRNLSDRRKRSDAIGSRHRRWLTSIALFVAVGLISLPVVLLAVHEFSMQLDGDITATTQTHFPTPADTQTIDWSSIFTAKVPKGADPVAVLPTGFKAATFIDDFNLTAQGGFATRDASTFATGSKDEQNPSGPLSNGAGGWQCNVDNNVNSKIDVINAYAASFTAPNGDRILYFAMERDANTGTADVGFWFLHDNVKCLAPPDATSGSFNFSGNHQDGDLLVVSEFTGGGQVSTIKVYEWAGGATGGLLPTAVADGVDCRTGAGTGEDQACAAANTVALSGIANVPWLTHAKTAGLGHTIPIAQFFEGGVNLTKSNISTGCFNVFIGDTRSSKETTATLFDFALGKLGECTSTVTTQSTPSTTVSINTGSVTVSDTATVTVTGVNSFPSGKVDFYLCGPAATSCDTTGKLIITKPITSNGTVSTGDQTVTSAGDYCWHAHFSAPNDPGVPDGDDKGANECFHITPRTPQLPTTAGPDVDFGQPVTDTLALSGTSNQPGTPIINPTTAGGPAGGTLKFTLYGPDNCTTVATGTGTNPQTVAVSGDGTYGPVSFTPDKNGTFHWVAEYTPAVGDPNNLMNSHNTGCTDANEDVVVAQIPTAIKTAQRWFPNDTAKVTSTVTGKTIPAGGEVTFSLYDNATCSGTAKYTEKVTLVGGGQDETVGTSNNPSNPNRFEITTDYPDATTKGPYSWKVVYDPKNATFIGRQSSCDAEHFSIPFVNDPGPGVKFP